MKRIYMVLFLAVLFVSSLFAAHVHKWNFFAEDNCIKAYCTQTSEASECNYQGINKALVLEIGSKSSKKLEVTVLPEKASNKNLVWTSSNPEVAKVKSDGTLVALSFGSTTITAKATDGSSIVSNPITIEVKKGFEVIFDTNGATEGSVSQVSVKEGEKISTPTAILTKTGYTFGGWYKDTSCTDAWNFDTDTVTAATTLYAKWTANTYTITYKDKDNATFSGTFGTNYPMIHTYGSTTTLINPTKTGYTFSGWYTSSNCTGSAVSSIGGTDKTSDFTLYAKWTAKTYTITYKDKDNAAFTGTFGTNYPTSHTYDSATTLVSPTKSGYTFGGWFASSDCSGTAFTSIEAKTRTSDFTLYAKWTAATPPTAADALVEGAQCILQTTAQNSYCSYTFTRTKDGYTTGEVIVNGETLPNEYKTYISGSANNPVIVFSMSVLQFSLNTSTNKYTLYDLDYMGDPPMTVPAEAKTADKTTITSFSVKPNGASSFTDITSTISKSTT